MSTFDRSACVTGACCALVAMLCVLPGAAGAADGADTNAVATGAVQRVDGPAKDNMWDRGQGAISRYVIHAADSLDDFLRGPEPSPDSEHGRKPRLEHFYGDRRAHELSSGSSSYIELTPRVVFSESGVKPGVDFSAKLRLPQFSERLQLFASRQKDDTEVSDGISTRQSRQDPVTTERDGSAGLRYFMGDVLGFKSSVSAGLRLNNGVVPRLKLHAQIGHTFDDWTVRFTESGFWTSDDGFGEKSQLDVIRRLTRHLSIKSSSDVVWSETSEGLDLGQSISLLHSFRKRHAIGLKLGVGAHTQPETVADVYFIRIPYRKQLHRDWLYLEIEPGVDFNRDDHFDAAPMIAIRFDMMFGSIPH